MFKAWLNVGWGISIPFEGIWKDLVKTSVRLLYFWVSVCSWTLFQQARFSEFHLRRFICRHLWMLLFFQQITYIKLVRHTCLAPLELTHLYRSMFADTSVTRGCCLVTYKRVCRKSRNFTVVSCHQPVECTEIICYFFVFLTSVFCHIHSQSPIIQLLQ